MFPAKDLQKKITLNTAVMTDTMNTNVLIQICLFYRAKLAHANPSQT